MMMARTLWCCVALVLFITTDGVAQDGSLMCAAPDTSAWYTRQDVPSAASNDWQSMVDTSTWNSLCSSVLSRKKLSREVCRAAFGMRSSNWPADNGGMGSHIMRWCQDHTSTTADDPTYVIRQGIGCGVSVAIRFGVTSWAGCDGEEKKCKSCGCYATVGVPGNNAEWASYKDTLGCYHSYHDGKTNNGISTFGRSTDNNGWFIGAWNSPFRAYGYSDGTAATAGTCFGAKHLEHNKGMTEICPNAQFGV